MTEDQTNGQPRGLKPFVKGDPRINRHGRPRGFDQVRKLAQAIAHEELTLSNGQKMSVVEAILRSWVVSKEPMLQIRFMEIAFGKVPDTPATDPFEDKPTIILHYAHEFDKIVGKSIRDSASGGEGPLRLSLPDAD